MEVQQGEQFSNFNSSSEAQNLDEKYRILKNRLLLIGENLVEHKEETSQKILEIKKSIEIIRQSVERLTSFLEMASAEFSKFAKKDDVEILAKQIRLSRNTQSPNKKGLKK